MEALHQRQPRPSPIAALIRQGAEDAGRQQGTARASTKVQRMINSLQWRQAHSRDDFYPLALDSGAVLRLRQLQAGEVTGLGTGATVWPAAHVLAKYLERKFGSRGMKGYRVVDLGSGTGVVGIVAASLGAVSYLTDQEQLHFLMRENAGFWKRDMMDVRVASETQIATVDSATSVPAPSGAIHVVTYNWGLEDEQLSSPVDIILVSDCVLPKLYPIEPLVAAIDRLSGPETVTIMSYEHRYYQAFDPRLKFEELAAARGLVKTKISQSEQHPIFSADDIEIWELRRQPEVAAAKLTESRRELCTGQTSGVISLNKPGHVVVYQQPQTSLAASGQVKACVELLGEIHELVQVPSGALGCYLWPSALVVARHLVAESTRGKVGDTEDNLAKSSALLYPLRARVLEVGSGVGLVAMAAALIGWDVVATDKADVLPLLEANVNRCLESTTRECCCRVVQCTCYLLCIHMLLSERRGDRKRGRSVLSICSCCLAAWRGCLNRFPCRKGRCEALRMGHGHPRAPLQTTKQ